MAVFSAVISGDGLERREQVKALYHGDKVKECTSVVGETAMLVGEMLERL